MHNIKIVGEIFEARKKMQNNRLISSVRGKARILARAFPEF
jgi:hypothetical protein